MTNEIQEQGREEVMDHFYAKPIGSRREKIEELYCKLLEKYNALSSEIHKKYESSFTRINQKCQEVAPTDTFGWLHEQGYFDLMNTQHNELNDLQETPLGRIVFNDFIEILDRSDHENMLDASDGLFRLDSDPIIKNVLTDSIYVKGLKKKQKDRERIYGGRRMKKHTYEKYLSEAVGRSITIEEYEREFGVLSDK